MARKYNFIYSQLVENENDVVGHIAYSIYKSAKVEFIENFKEQHGGAEPTEEDFERFHESCRVSANLEGYKTQAVAVIRNFVDDMLAATTQQIEKDYRDSQDKRLQDIVKPLRPSFWNGVGQSIAGAFFFALLVAAFAFIKSYSG